MSDDRAERIQRIREGRRDRGSDLDGAEEHGADDPDEATTAPATDVGDAVEPTADGSAPAGTDRGDAIDRPDATTAEQPDTTSAGQADATDRPDATSQADAPAGSAAGDDGEEADARSDAESISVIEFVLGDERYCLEISYVEQIVEREAVTRIPNAPSFVEGVIDLRGDITTVIDPKQTLATDDDDDGDRIVVFDSEQMDDEWSVGWTVDGVHRVSTVPLSSVRESPVDEPWINGVIKRDDDEFVIWTEPGELMRLDADER